MPLVITLETAVTHSSILTKKNLATKTLSINEQDSNGSTEIWPMRSSHCLLLHHLHLTHLVVDGHVGPALLPLLLLLLHLHLDQQVVRGVAAVQQVQLHLMVR